MYKRECEDEWLRLERGKRTRTEREKRHLSNSVNKTSSIKRRWKETRGETNDGTSWNEQKQPSEVVFTIYSDGRATKSVFTVYIIYVESI